MKRTKVKVQTQNTGTVTDDRTIMLSEGLVKRWKIPSNTSLQLRFGSARQEVKVAPAAQAGILRIHDSLAARWGLAQDVPLCLLYKPKTRTLHLGPLLGVMVSRVYAGMPDRPFGAITEFCREVHHACGVYGAAVYFFTPDELAGAKDMVKGWRYNGKWERGVFPVPHVVYNRLTSRKLENRAVVQQFLEHARTQHHAVVFNERYLNKTEVFDALAEENRLQIYLPESYMLNNIQTLKSMCAKHGTVFIKPVTGSLGKGIIRIKRQPDHSYVCHFTHSAGTRKQTYTNLARLFTALAGKMKRQRYQIQQGLPLIEAGGRPIDFRALVQRNETGQWHITSIVARIAGNRHFVSNLARGGSLTTVKEALARSGSIASSGGSVKLRRAALAIAKGVEERIPGHFAELGIDLALDTQGRVWLIEVNSKPSKDLNTALAPERKMRPSVRRLIKYSRFAAKF